MKRRIICILCCLCLLSMFSGCSRVPKPGDDWNTLDPFLQKLEKEDQFSGVVLVAQGDRILFQHAYGMSDREKDIRSTMETQFNLASITKLLTAVAIGRLVDQGKLSLDDRICSYVSGLPELAEKVTLRQLLSHTSGFGDIPDVGMRTTEEYLDYIRKQPILFEPGTRFSYSNSGYILLGAVIEKVSGMTYFDFVKKEVLEPAGMTHTGFPDTAKLYSGAAIPYAKAESSEQWQPVTDKLMPVGRADGGAYSTAEDMMKFWLALQGNKLLSPETQMEFTKSVIPTYFSDNIDFGYGFMVEEWDGIKLFGHNGGAEGVSTWTDFYPSTGLITVVLSNYDQAAFPVEEQIRKYIISGFKAPYPIPSAPLCILMNGKPITMPKEPIPSDDFVGVPVEPIVEPMGRHVSLDAEKKHYVVSNADGSWKLEGKIGNKEALLNGKKVKLSDKAFLSDGQLMLPPVSLAEILGGRVILEGSVLQYYIE